MLIINALLPVFLLILLGWGLRAYRIIPENEWIGIQSLGYWVLFPAVLIDALVQIDFNALELSSLISAYLSAVILLMILTGALYLLRSNLSVSGPQFSSIFQTATRWNAFIALAIVSELLGDIGLALVAAIMALTVPLLNIINVMTVSYTASAKRPTILEALITTFKNPFLIGALIGLAINFLHIPITKPLASALDLIAKCGLGIGLLTVGAGLRLRLLAQPQIKMFIGAIYKVVLFPIITLGMCFIFNVTDTERIVAVLCASVPTAMNGYVLAKKMGGDAELYALSAAVQTVISFFSIPFFVYLANTL